MFSGETDIDWNNKIFLSYLPPLRSQWIDLTHHFGQIYQNEIKQKETFAIADYQLLFIEHFNHFFVFLSIWIFFYLN